MPGLYIALHMHCISGDLHGGFVKCGLLSHFPHEEIEAVRGE